MSAMPTTTTANPSSVNRGAENPSHGTDGSVTSSGRGRSREEPAVLRPRPPNDRHTDEEQREVPPSPEPRHTKTRRSAARGTPARQREPIALVGASHRVEPAHAQRDHGIGDRCVEPVERRRGVVQPDAPGDDDDRDHHGQAQGRRFAPIFFGSGGGAPVGRRTRPWAPETSNTPSRPDARTRCSMLCLSPGSYSATRRAIFPPPNALRALTPPLPLRRRGVVRERRTCNTNRCSRDRRRPPLRAGPPPALRRPRDRPAGSWRRRDDRRPTARPTGRRAAGPRRDIAPPRPPSPAAPDASAGHRGWKRQPGGMRVGSGGSPRSSVRARPL